METLSGNFIQLCSRGFQIHCLSQIQICLHRASIFKRAFVSWCPDPGAWAVDAFSFCWSEFKPYIFPPFSLLGTILTKLKVEEVPDALVIAPWGPTAHWYSPLLQLLVQRPILLPQWDELLTLPQEDFLCLLYTSPSPRDQRGSRMPSSA